MPTQRLRRAGVSTTPEMVECLVLRSSCCSARFRDLTFWADTWTFEFLNSRDWFPAFRVPGIWCGRWRVAKRPGLDEFLKEMVQLYEIVVFTDSMGGLADEVREGGRERDVRASERFTKVRRRRFLR